MVGRWWVDGGWVDGGVCVYGRWVDGGWVGRWMGGVVNE